MKTEDLLSLSGEKVGYILSYEIQTAKQMLLFSNAIEIHTEYSTEFEELITDNGFLDCTTYFYSEVVGDVVISSIRLMYYDNEAKQKELLSLIVDYIKSKDIF